MYVLDIDKEFKKNEGGLEVELYLSIWILRVLVLKVVCFSPYFSLVKIQS